MQGDLLVDAGDLDALRVRARAGSWRAACRLAETGDLDGAVEGLRIGTDPGDTAAAVQLADLLAAHRSVDDAIEVLRATLLAATATEERNIDPEVLGTAGYKLADLLAQTGGDEALRSEADSGNVHAADRLARLLADRGDLRRRGRGATTLRRQRRRGRRRLAHQADRRERRSSRAASPRGRR